MDVNIKYIELAPEGPAGEEDVIIIEHEPETFFEVQPPEVDQGKHRSMYTHKFTYLMLNTIIVLHLNS